MVMPYSPSYHLSFLGGVATGLLLGRFILPILDLGDTLGQVVFWEFWSHAS